jgi:carboxymethylenebutenolidase
MCNEDILHHEAQSRQQRGLSRRDFTLLALSAAAVAMLPGATHAGAMTESSVEIDTGEGKADCFFVHASKGKHPGVLMWPDFMGLRPAYMQLATKLAHSGYAVLVVNPYYRNAKAPIMEKADFENKEAMTKLGEYTRALSTERIRSDATAYLAFLDGHTSVDATRKLGTQGYCMSGRFALLTAATAPERVGAFASFHGGGLAREDSLALISTQLKAQALIAIAADDDAAEPEAKTTLRQAFDKVKLPAEIEVYEGAKHGWCTPDMVSLYHEAQAKRAWGRLLALYERAL